MRFRSALLVLTVASLSGSQVALAQVNLLHPPHHVYLTPKPTAKPADTPAVSTVQAPAASQTPAPSSPVGAAVQPTTTAQTQATPHP